MNFPIILLGVIISPAFIVLFNLYYPWRKYTKKPALYQEIFGENTVHSEFREDYVQNSKLIFVLILNFLPVIPIYLLDDTLLTRMEVFDFGGYVPTVILLIAYWVWGFAILILYHFKLNSTQSILVFVSLLVTSIILYIVLFPNIFLYLSDSRFLFFN